MKFLYGKTCVKRPLKNRQNKELNKKKQDFKKWKLMTVDHQERSTWRSGVISAMRAASQLPGRGPTDVDDAPAPAC